MAATLLNLVEKHDYQTLFLEHLRWSRPDQPPLAVQLNGNETYHVANISSYKGLRVWVCPQLPNSSDQAAVDRAIAKTSTDRLVIFHDDTKQIWRWPVRTIKAGSVNTRLTSHVHVKGRENPKLAKRLEAITLGIAESLSATDVIERVKRAFDVETEKETKRASKLMVSMFDALTAAGTPEHEISVTLARTLFLMFGDDTDMWAKDLFQNFIINHTRPDGADLADRLNELFIYLDTKPETREAAPPHLNGVRYVNGGLFRERITLPPVGRELRTAILDACSSDWADISPAIFGSMFQSVRDAKTRREFGEHYTSEKDILRTLNPLFLDELREEYAKAVDHREETALLTRLRERLARIHFLDPACGCGNFIIIAYRELRLLEIAILERLKLKESQRSSKVDASQLEIAVGTADDRQGRGKTTFLDPKVVLDNFFGIEIDEWPARIAETAMFLMDRQCDLQMIERLGYAPERLPIRQQATIVTATEDNLGRGNSLRFEWSDLFQPDDDTIVAGNPPYAGQSLRTDEQTADLQLAWGNDYDGYLDYVTGWHAKALAFLSSTKGARFAYVTTNSIAQGQPVPALFEPIFRDGWRIRFAHRTFPWESEASGKAAVHCVIVGFDKGGPQPQLWDYSGGKGAVQHNEVPFINAYLVDGPNVLVRKRSKPLTPSLPEVNYGSKPVDGGFLVVKKPEYPSVMADPIAMKYLRSFIGADELINGSDRWCLWLVDAPGSDIQASPILRERVEGVRQMRLASTKAATRIQAATPHLFTEIRQPKRHYLCVPSVVSENRMYLTTARMEPEVITSNLAFTAPDDDGFLFALISSSLFMVWQRMVGGRLKSDYRFSNTIVWNNFPLGNTHPEARKVIIEAGSRVLAARTNHPGASLESLYDPNSMPKDLLTAHLALDKEVDSFFGIPPGALELDRQRLLLERYAKYAKR
ncbi:class I SAM-dependent DNA methyltransferase [Arthrobacter sp. 2RAF6]|uniref:class I SAM-dependent DNA methyltransferase n=1 Tax=Arthrobacter sp. 2RAF6 TaxID=3233002 RepID=UPI003F911245